MHRVPDIYAEQYEWADWRHRWGDFDPDSADLRVNAVARRAGSATSSPSPISVRQALRHRRCDAPPRRTQPRLTTPIRHVGRRTNDRRARWR
jgi:hypothetical protein